MSPAARARDHARKAAQRRLGPGELLARLNDYRERGEAPPLWLLEQARKVADGAAEVVPGLSPTQPRRRGRIAA
jgi:hypothetical protein